MKNSAKSEIWKAFHNNYFYLAIIVGCIIAMLDVVENAIAVDTFSKMPSVGGGFSGYSLFVRWIAVNNHTYGCSLFYTVWPVIAAMPYGWSYLKDRRTGFYNQCVSRSNIKEYYFSKYLAVFASGGFVVTFPVAVNLFANALVCPYCVPLVTSKITGIFDGWFMSELFYSQPWAFGFIWLGMNFLLGGVTACLCLTTGTKLYYHFLVILMPFAVYYVTDVLYSMVGKLRYWEHMWSPLHLTRAACFNANPEWLLFGVISALLLISFVLGYRQVVKNELV